MTKSEGVNPKHCPICGQNNYCGNLSSNENEACWCNDSNISFPAKLLSLVSDTEKNKVCICKTCALAHKTEEPKPV